MRIMTRTQYDAIVDIVTEKDKKIAELEAKIAKKDETIDYLNDKLFERTRQVSELKKVQLSSVYGHMTPIDFPATTKQPENKLFY